MLASLLRYAPQNILHCVGKSCKAHYNKQVRQSPAQKSVISVGLLEAWVVGGSQRYMPVEEQQPVLTVVCFPIGDDVRKWESRGPAVELLLRFLFLLDFLEKRKRKMERWRSTVLT